MKPSRWRLAGVWLTMFWLVGVVMFAKHNFALGVLPIVTLWGAYLVVCLKRWYTGREKVRSHPDRSQ